MKTRTTLKFAGIAALMLATIVLLSGTAFAAAPAAPGVIAGPTVEPAPTPHPDTILAHLVWEGRPAQPDKLQQLPLIFVVVRIDVDPPVEKKFDIPYTDEMGTFSVAVSDLPAGAYEWHAKGPTYLSEMGTFTLAGPPTLELELGKMRAGDINGDNVVNISDFNTLRSSFGKAEGDAGYNPTADITGDKHVDTRDFTILKKNLGQVGN